MAKFVRMSIFSLKSSIVLLILTLATPAQASCHSVLGAPSAGLGAMEPAFRDILHELALLQIKIDTLKGDSGAISISIAGMLEDEFKFKKDEVLKLLQEHRMTKQEFDFMLSREIERIQNQRDLERASEENHRQTQTQTMSRRSNPAQKGTFNLVLAGTVPEGLEPEKEIAKNFLLMNAPVSQHLWKKVGELIEQHLPKRSRLPSLEPSHFAGLPDHPVENVSYETVVKWLGGLNELSRRGVEELNTLFADHHPRDVYDLPSLDEMHLVTYILIQEIPNWSHPILIREPTKRFAWIGSPSKPLPSTNPIATLNFLADKDGNVFWDLIGNVEEFTKETYNHRADVTPMVATFGGSYRTNNFMRAHSQDSKNSYTGFRLVRRTLRGAP